MRRALVTMTMSCCLLACGYASAEPAGQVAPSQAEIQNDFDAGKYADVTKKVSRVIALKGEQAKAFDRSALLALKGEAHLHLRQSAVAMDAFTLAAKESTDLSRASELRALAALVKRSPGNLFQPKATAEIGTTKPAGIDIVASDSRKRAFEAMFNEDSPAVLTKTQAIRLPEPSADAKPMSASSTKALLDVVVQLSDLRTIERLGTDTDAVTQPALARLAPAAGTTFAETISKDTPRVETIQGAASNRHGLSGADTSGLREIIDFSRRAAAASNALASVAEDPAHKKNEADATKLAERAEQVLKADYGGAASARPGPDNTNDDQRDSNGLPKVGGPRGGGAGSVPGVGGIGIGGF